METMLELQLKGRSRARVLQGHPWVFRNELEAVPSAEADGQGVVLRDGRGRLLGSGIVNTQSQITWRRYSREEEAFDEAFLAAGIRKALERRGEVRYGRLVWSEADDLPGLIVDRFDTVLVVQALTRAVDERVAVVTSILQEMLSPQEIVFRNDAPTRKKEGLERETGTASGKALAPFEAEIDGIVYRLDLVGAQKTGFYLDQREEQVSVGALATGRRVLDAFCNQGSFALQAAKAGASEVLGLDSSEEAVALARENAKRNNLLGTFAEANVFDWFTENRREKFGLIVLDPPSFARNRAAVPGALRGYKEINLRALRLLEPGGVLATYSCSQHVDAGLFRAMLEEAAGDSHREVRLLRTTGQPLDHPVRLGFPESEYLCGAILAVE